REGAQFQRIGIPGHKTGAGFSDETKHLRGSAALGGYRDCSVDRSCKQRNEGYAERAACLGGQRSAASVALTVVAADGDLRNRGRTARVVGESGGLRRA